MMNIKIIGKYFDGQYTNYSLTQMNPYMNISVKTIGNVVDKQDSELVKLGLDYIFKTLFVDRAMPEVIKKADETANAVNELKALVTEAKSLIDELKTETSKLKTEQDDIKKAFVLQDNLTEEQKALILANFEAWEVGKEYKINDVVKYNDILYKVIQAHKSQADWTPDKAVSLFTLFKNKVEVEGVEVIPDFIHPTGAHDTYKIGDKVRFKNKIYESIIDNNAYSPSEYPRGWKEITQ